MSFFPNRNSRNHTYVGKIVQENSTLPSMQLKGPKVKLVHYLDHFLPAPNNANSHGFHERGDLTENALSLFNIDNPQRLLIQVQADRVRPEQRRLAAVGFVGDAADLDPKIGSHRMNFTTPAPRLQPAGWLGYNFISS